MIRRAFRLSLASTFFHCFVGCRILLACHDDQTFLWALQLRFPYFTTPKQLAPTTRVGIGHQSGNSTLFNRVHVMWFRSLDSTYTAVLIRITHTFVHGTFSTWTTTTTSTPACSTTTFWWCDVVVVKAAFVQNNWLKEHDIITTTSFDTLTTLPFN